MGTSDLDSIHSSYSIERRVVNIQFHPKYEPGKAYYDVGIAEAGELITFNDYIRPVCLPYLPIDDADNQKQNVVTLAAWGYTVQARNTSGTVELISNLKLRSLKVKSEIR